MSSRPANKAIHLSVLRVTPLARRRKRRAARPAVDGQRWTDSLTRSSDRWW
jgi:hypothetical protein